MATRREVRAQPFAQYDETGLQELLESCDGRMRALEDRYLRMMGEHIADIGQMWPSDVHRLQQIRRMNRNLKDLQRRIAKAAGMDEDDVLRIFEQTAQADARMAAKILGAPDTVRVAENEALSRILRAQARETAGRMRDLANSTAVSEPYRRAVDAAVTAVQSGVEDYNTAVRRVIRQAGKTGLRVVDYESGHSRRLDSAARMNVLDGVRHLNQSIMEEVGREFGADGVEIDAHMLCAEDHLPYQGQQFSQEDFERIQDGLKRPFGEWNCRHSWHPILMGISPPTYTDEQLSEMERYSTEQIEIGGRTKTRYEWSQEMRRMETAIRQEKDAATLAAAVGDEELRRECQGTITELNRQYGQLAGKAGLKPEYERTYVSGFRDVKGEQGLTGAASGGMMMSDSSNRRQPITPESLQAVPRFTEFGTNEANEAVRKACIEILTDLTRDKVGTEETITLPLSKVNDYLLGELNMNGLKRKGPQGKGRVTPIDINEPYIGFHNHPGCKTFSFNDVDEFGKRPNCMGIVVIGNNGHDAYTLLKGESYDHFGFSVFRFKIDKGHINYKPNDRFLKGMEIYGVQYSARRY